MTEIIIVVLMLVLLIFLVIITIYFRRKEKTNTRYNPSLEQNQQAHLVDDTLSNQMDFISDKNESDAFEEITSLIKDKFQPASFKDDEDCHRLLISFLTENLPNNIITQGHTVKGDKLDIVIDGTYALELIVADTEEKLSYLMDLSLKSKKDFDKTAVIIVDVKKIPSSKIQEFAAENERRGIRTIIVEVNY